MRAVEEPVDWVSRLVAQGPEAETALAQLHALLVRVARSEVRRRNRLGLAGPELDDLANQAADDAVLAITRKLATFRGDSQFTTWAYKFVILEVSNKLGRHVWLHPTVGLEPQDWERLPDRLGVAPSDAAQHRDLLAALTHAVEHELSVRQRRVFTAIVLEGMPLDALALELHSNRNALYKTMFDARRKIRAALVANGYLQDAVTDSSDRQAPIKVVKG